jgi:hypothetical protein
LFLFEAEFLKLNLKDDSGFRLESFCEAVLLPLLLLLKLPKPNLKEFLQEFFCFGIGFWFSSSILREFCQGIGGFFSRADPLDELPTNFSVDSRIDEDLGTFSSFPTSEMFVDVDAKEGWFFLCFVGFFFPGLEDFSERFGSVKT